MKHRKLKTCLLIACIPILALVFYAMLDFTPMAFKTEYRLAAKAAMVGPGEILGISTLDPTPSIKGGSYDVLAARTEHGVILYDGNIAYRKDLGEDVILISGATYRGDSIPLVLFDEYPEAVYAKIELKFVPGLGKGSNDTSAGKAVSLDAKREHDGCFVFLLEQGKGFDMLALSRFSAGYDLHDDPIPGYVWLYNKDDELVTCGSLEMLSPGIIAHRERGEDWPGHGIGG